MLPELEILRPRPPGHRLARWLGKIAGSRPRSGGLKSPSSGAVWPPVLEGSVAAVIDLVSHSLTSAPCRPAPLVLSREGDSAEAEYSAPQDSPQDQSSRGRWLRSCSEWGCLRAQRLTIPVWLRSAIGPGGLAARVKVLRAPEREILRQPAQDSCRRVGPEHRPKLS